MFNKEEIKIIEKMFIDTQFEIKRLKKEMLYCENSQKLNNLLEQYYNLRVIEKKLRSKITSHIASIL
jgi:hypothetical protein